MSDTETNGNVKLRGCTSASSAEDLSEYTDADESISAPTEFLAEFLSAVLLKDYETALKYCKLILQYEPNNGTAKEFYPLIIEKLQMTKDDDSSDSEDCSESESSSSSHSSCSSSRSGSSEDDNKPTDEDATTGSYSSLEEDEADHENNAIGYNSRYTSSDITNGNAEAKSSRPARRSSEARLTEAIQKKLQDRAAANTRVARLPLGKTRSTVSMGLQSPESESVTSPDSEQLTWGERSPDTDLGNRVWEEKSPESELSMGFPFSSGSESPSDPFSQLTIEDAPTVRINN